MRGETYFPSEDEYRDALREFYRVILQYNAPEWQAAALPGGGQGPQKLSTSGRRPPRATRSSAPRFPADRNAEEAGRRLEAARRRAARPADADNARTR